MTKRLKTYNYLSNDNDKNNKTKYPKRVSQYENVNLKIIKIVSQELNLNMK